MYLKLSVAGHLTIFLTRTRGPFWSIRPAKILWGAVLGTQIVATLIAVFGIFMAPISWKWAAFVWIYALAWALINDRVKLGAYWVLDRTEAGATPEARARRKIEAKVEPKSESKPEPKPALPPESKAGSKAAPKPDAKPEVKSESKPDAEIKPETKAADSKPEARPEAKAITSSDLTPQIATRAYELYEQQGHRDGKSIQNWDEAEREIRKDEGEAKPKPEAKAEPTPEAKTEPKPKPEPTAETDLTPQLVKRVHALYEELGRADVQAVEDLEKSEHEKREVELHKK